MTVVEQLAVAATGCLFGALVFASFVDARTYVRLTKEKSLKTIKTFFFYWWPNGRDLMVPLVIAASLTNFASYLSTGKTTSLYAALVAFSIGPYTAIVLGEAIKQLLDQDPKETAELTRAFCARHHPRTVVAGIAYYLSIRVLASS